MKATVIVPTLGLNPGLPETLAGLLAQRGVETDAEVLVVDNAGLPSTLALCGEIGTNAALPLRHVFERRPGLHNARHRGALEARGELLVYVDDDVLLDPRWLGRLLAPFADPTVACVGGPVRLSFETAPPVWLSQFEPWYLSGLDLGPKQRELTWPEAVNGNNMAIRRTVLFAVGGFHPDAFADPTLMWYRGDGEGGLVRRLYASGRRVIYEPTAFLLHRIPAARLTKEYFRRRAFSEGISGSFSLLRERGRTSGWQVAAMLTSVRCLVKVARREAGAMVRPSRSVRARADAAFWRAFASHHLRVLMNRDLRDHVHRPDFLG